MVENDLSLLIFFCNFEEFKNFINYLQWVLKVYGQAFFEITVKRREQ